MRFVFHRVATTAAALCLLSGLAQAEPYGFGWTSWSDRGPDTVLSRVVAGDMPTVRDRYEGLGYRAGQFWVLPSLELGFLYDSNVFAQSSGASDDAVFYATPNVAVKSDFGRHALNFNFEANHYEYVDFGSQSRTDLNGSMDGEIEVQHDLRVRGGVRGGLFQQTLGDLEYPGGGGITTPGDYWKLGTWAEVEKHFNQIVVAARAAYDLQTYDAVEGVDQSFRDGDRFAAGGRAGWYVSPRARVTTQSIAAITSVGNATVVDGNRGPNQPPGQSDVRLKRDICKVGATPEGLKLYSYRYHWSEETFVGVMAQEVLEVKPEAVITREDGYYAVDYDMLGLTMISLDKWRETRRIH